MSIRKIYVEEGELVDIRVVPKGQERNASGFKEHVYPHFHKFLAKIGSSWIDIPVACNFTFMMDGKVRGDQRNDFKTEVEHECVVCGRKKMAIKGTRVVCSDGFCGANCRPVEKKELGT